MKSTKKNELIIFIITAILILIPIVLAFINPSYDTTETVKRGWLFFKKEVQVINHHEGPFANSGFAPYWAVVLYSIILFRNKNSMFNFDGRKGISIKAIILHCLDLLFLTTVCSLIRPDAKILMFDINCNVLLMFGIILSIFGMKSISGFVWIFVAICLWQTFIKIDEWGRLNWIYVLFAYASLVSQICILKLFKFDINEFLADFGVVKYSISRDVYQSTEVVKRTVQKSFNAAKKLATKH